MRRYVVQLILVACCCSAPAFGVLGTTDQVPAATLLLPYFEVDLASDGTPNEDRLTTEFEVRNVTGSPAIAHVVLWTDFAVPTVAFDLNLPAYGTATVNLIDVLKDNNLELGEDTPVNPAPNPPGYPSLFVDDFETGTIERWDDHDARISIESLQAFHGGSQDLRNELCGGLEHGDDIARGYITIDVANEAYAGNPQESGYFGAGGTGRISNDNILTGEYEIIDPANNFAHGNPLVHIEADGADALTTTSGNYTFYAAYVNATAIDNREPLGTIWEQRYEAESTQPASSTDYIYWRDPKTVTAPIVCGTAPAWYPLNVAQLTANADDGSPDDPATDTDQLPLACGRVEINAPVISTPFDSGVLYIDFNNVSGPILGSTDQAVVVVETSSAGRFSGGRYGFPQDNASDYNP